MAAKEDLIQNLYDTFYSQYVGTPNASQIAGMLSMANDMGDAIDLYHISSSPTGSTSGVTSISAGDGMDFTTITDTGSITLGTPSTLTPSTTNSVTSTSHTHAITTAAVTNGGTNLATGDQIYDFVIGLGYSTTTGTVTSVATSGAITGGPITTSGTISHLTTTGYKHIPSGGSSSQILQYSADGTAQWYTPPWTTNTGTVTSVTAGNGMTQTGTSTINPTLNIVSHAGTAGSIGTINIGADAIGVNLGTTSTTAFRGDYGNTAYTHSQDNSQAHSDYLINNGDDTTSGTLTAAGFIGPLTGNATTATNLANINTSFSGTYPMTVNVSGTIYSNANVTFDGTGNYITCSGGILPASDNTGVVGNSTYTWNSGYFTNMTIDSILNVRGAIDLADSDILRLGSSDDFEIFHDGANNYIDLNVGNLYIRDNTTIRWTFTRTSGAFYATGDVRTGGTFRSSDNSAGVNTTFSFYDNDSVLRTLVIKDGIITSAT